MNKQDVLGAFLLVNNPIVLSEEETKDVQKAIKKLQQENKELKLQLKGTTHCFDKEEHDKLKKQVEEYQQELEKADSITQSCIFNDKEESKISYRKCLNILDKKEAQQKEFIDYMNKIIEELECDDVDDEEMKGYLIQRIDTFKEILQKYKSIIGYKDEQN